MIASPGRIDMLCLPVPPSMNRYWRSIGLGRVIISKAGREYRERVIGLCRGCKRLTGPLSVRIEFYPPDRRRRDLDNLLKPLLDALAYGGVYEDDSQIDRLSIARCVDEPGWSDGGVVVFAEEIAP